MANGYTRPKTPASVERELRQEAGFGCARCGHPYIEYHHIVPYSEDHHFRPEDMVALCGNCHPAVSKQGRDSQYAIKRDPFNIRKELFSGALEYDKRDLIFKVGGNWYENTPVILQYFDTPIISCLLDEGQAKVSLNILDKNGTTILLVKENNVVFRPDDLWDFEYAHNLAVVHYKSHDIALRMDFRKPEAVIEGKIWLGDKQVKLGPNETNLPRGNSIKGCRFSNSGVGIQIGNSPASRSAIRLMPTQTTS